MYPNMESKVNAQLSKTGTFFQSYIRRGLANLEAEAINHNDSSTTGSTEKSCLSSASGINSSGHFGSSINGGSISLSTSTSLRESSDMELSAATALIATRRRESMISTSDPNGEGGSVTSLGSGAESYKDRLARLQQMFGYKNVSGSPFLLMLPALSTVLLMSQRLDRKTNQPHCLF
jgi:hypothetical protein